MTEEQKEIEGAPQDPKAVIAQVEAEVEQARQVAMHFLPDEGKQVVEQAKQAGASVFTIQVGDQFYVFRSLGRFEYQNMMIEQSKVAEKLMNEAPNQIAGRVMVEMRNQDEVVQKATLWPRLDPSNVKTVGAGVVETLHNSIMLASGFGQEPMPIKL